jgi:hypothetical protein
MPEPIITQMPAPIIPGAASQQTTAKPAPEHVRTQGGFRHTPNPEHIAKQDLDRHDRSGMQALKLAVEVAKTRPTETDAQTLERAAAYRKFLKETTH